MYVTRQPVPVLEFGSPHSRLDYSGSSGTLAFGDVGAADGAGATAGAFLLWTLGLVVIGGVIIWVVKSVRK